MIEQAVAKAFESIGPRLLDGGTPEIRLAIAGVSAEPAVRARPSGLVRSLSSSVDMEDQRLTGRTAGVVGVQSCLEVAGVACVERSVGTSEDVDVVHRSLGERLGD